MDKYNELQYIRSAMTIVEGSMETVAMQWRDEPGNKVHRENYRFWAGVLSQLKDREALLVEEIAL